MYHSFFLQNYIFFIEKHCTKQKKLLSLQPLRWKHYSQCENSSVGRAQPCQGWGRGFESRFSLTKVARRPGGGMVDTKDLKSFDHCGCAGSSPALGTKKGRKNLPFSFLYNYNLNGNHRDTVANYNAGI